MKEWYLNQKIEYKVALWSLAVIAGLFILLIPFFFFSLMEVPQGIALGGTVGIITYLILGLTNNSDKPKRTIVFTAIAMTLRILFIGGILFLVGWLYYGLGVKAFNIFAVAGGYFIPLATNIILARKE